MVDSNPMNKRLRNVPPKSRSLPRTIVPHRPPTASRYSGASTIPVITNLSSVMFAPAVDMVIPVAPKDLSKLPYVIESVRKYVDVCKIYIITPNPDAIKQQWSNMVVHSDAEVLPYDRYEIQYRPNWVFQQMLKVFQNVTYNDWFLVMDADIIVNQCLPLWTDARKPILYLGRDQAHGPYFGFNEQVLGFGKVYPWSFLSEFTLYSKSLVREMLQFCGLTLDEFWEKLVHITTAVCCPADSELYGSYIVHEHPGLYDVQHLVSVLGGRYNSHIWLDDEIKKEIQGSQSRNPKAHLISLHSWGDG